ncbi:hypothetical protein U9M48_019499 [Paspalum notatum var. saurae]|uniref:Uncharacterized protein n=1 Tax=Paspalum notatum var. saurae TaxID=547442 RepID=A0AAQ3TE27_PASNO
MRRKPFLRRGQGVRVQMEDHPQLGAFFRGLCRVDSGSSNSLGAELEEQVEEQQAEGQMEVDADEEARADAELAASHAANPMMDGVETGGSSSHGTIRSWREVGWSGVGHRMPVNLALGAFYRFYYPGMVTLPNRDRVAANKWSHWGLKEHVEGHAQGGGTCQGAERYRLDGEGDYDKEKMAKRVFQKAATKVVRDSFSNAHIQAIVNFHKRVKNINIKKTPEVKKMHLEAEELIQGEVDWIMKDPKAWRWTTTIGRR